MRLSQYRTAINECGVSGALNMFISRRRLQAFLPRTGSVQLRGYRHPVHFRRVATDRYVIGDVLLDRQYECVAGLSDVRVIVDAGANIGTASLYFLKSYPLARVIAIEPDSGNFAMLRQNLGYYGERVTAAQLALWYRLESLAIDRGNFRDGGEWSTQVKSAGLDQAGEVSGKTLDALSRDYGLERIDILKIDIEGAERFILNESFSECLERVRVLAIELHDDECRDRFRKHVGSLPGKVSQHGEVCVWRNARFAMPE